MLLNRLFGDARDRTAQLAQQFGQPNSRTLIICTRNPNVPTPYLAIEPRPHIQEVNPRLIETYKSIPSLQIELSDLQVVISGRYALEDLTGRGVYYLIDAEWFAGNEPEGGFTAGLVPESLVVRRGLGWEMLLRRSPQGGGN